MKKQLYIVAILILFTSCSVQKNNREVNLQYYDFFNSMKDKNFEKTANYFPDKITEIVTKQELIDGFEMMFNNPDALLQIYNPKIIEQKKIQKIDDLYYCALNTSYIMAFKFKVPNENDIKDFEELQIDHKYIRKMQIEKMRPMMKELYKTEDFEYNDENQSIKMTVQHWTYGISKNGRNNWKFLMLSPNMKELASEIIPESIIKE